MTPPGFTVFVDDNFHYMDEDERYKLGTFATYEEALEACRTLIRRDLGHFLEAGTTRDQLIAQYCSFGEDPFIVPTPEGVERFSARDYARELAREMCG